MTEQQMAETIEINDVYKEENKEKPKSELNRVDTVYGHAMNLKVAFDEETDLYEPTNWRLSVYWAHLWILYILFVIGGNPTVSAICVVVYILEFIVHIILVIIAFVRKSKNNSTFTAEIGLILGVSTKDPKNIYNLDQVSGHYVGPIFLIMGGNMCLAMIVHRLYAISLNVDGGIDMCCLMLWGSNFLMLPSMGVMLTILLFQFYAIDDKIVIKMLKFKDERIIKIQNNKIGEELNELIYDKTLKDWQKGLEFSERRVEYIFIFIFAAVWIAYGVEWNGDPENTPFAKFYFIWTSVSGGFAMSILFYFFSSAARYFYYPTLVMKKFTNPIEGDNVQDFVLWWQLRRHYIENDVRITGKVMNVILSAAVLVSIITLTVMLQFVFQADEISDLASYVWKLMFLVFVIWGFILYLAQNATLFYEEQLKHKWMLIREKLRIESKVYDGDYAHMDNDGNNLNDDGDMKTREDEQLIRVIDAMIVDIETTVISIEMSGVKMTPGIMILIRGYIASGIVALAASFF